MKRFRLFTLAVALCLLPALCLAGNSFFTTVLDEVTIAASANSTSDAVDMDVKPGATGGLDGYFSLQLITTAGTVKVQRQCTNDTANWPGAAPSVWTDLLTGKTVGNYQPESITLPVSKACKFRVVETGGAENATVTVILGVQ